MVLYIDLPLWPAHGTLWSHLISDTSYAELHEFAAQLGIPRRGFDLDHYDVPASLYDQAVAAGALAVDPRVVVERLTVSGLRVKQSERDAARPVRRLQFLRDEWQQLGRAIKVLDSSTPSSSRSNAQASNWQRLGAEVLSRWGESHRGYHNLVHLEDVLLALDQLSRRGETVAPETLTAAWFHDAVYRGDAHDETASAQYAQDSLALLGLPDTFVSLVGDFIIATTPGHPLTDLPQELALLLDADLAIFASPMSRYDEYSASVRSEYAHVPSDAFRSGRAHILRGYLARPEIYATDTARALWEARARTNLSREISRLELDA